MLVEAPDTLRLAVPVPPGEALWIGLTLPAGSELASAGAGGRPLAMESLGAGPDGAFLRSAPFGADGETGAEIVLRGPGGEARMQLELGGLDAFNRRFGFSWSHEPAPDSYGNWRLP